MVTNLLTMESIGAGQFVRVRQPRLPAREPFRSSLCAKVGGIRVVAPLQPKNQNLEAQNFWPTKHTKRRKHSQERKPADL